MTSGIYCFKHESKPFIYIGSSVNIEERYNHHLIEFNNNRHHNKSLQRDWLNGELCFEILAKGINKENLIRMEQSYCENYLDLGYLLYNKVLPRPQGYEGAMLCSKKYFDNQVNAQLEVCMDYITKLTKKVRELEKRDSLIVERNAPNIFSQIEEYGEIKEW